eukprot:CCRYP_013520-RA/>CCRYP_013520-RA protein AED:0.46 eAED:0.79 QI:0/0.5/0/1/0/0/3/0/233
MAEKKHIQHRHRERQQKFDKQLRGPSQHRHAQLSSLDDIPLHKMGSCRQIVMIVCIILIEKYALPTFFGNSYGSTELSSIPDLLFAMLNNPGYLIVLTRLPVASGETTDLSKVSTAITNEHAKSIVKTIILVGFVVCFFRQHQIKKYHRTFPGIAEYVIGISTIIWAAIELIFRESGPKAKRMLTSINCTSYTMCHSDVLDASCNVPNLFLASQGKPICYDIRDAGASGSRTI